MGDGTGCEYFYHLVNFTSSHESHLVVSRTPAPASPTPRQRPAQERGQRTRARVLECAEALFAEHGYSGTSLDAIAAEAGIHKPGICYYFPTKRALYEAVMVDVLGYFEALVNEALSTPGSIRARLLRSVESWVDGLASRPTAARLILHEAANPDPAAVAQAFRGMGDRVDPLFENAFQQLLPDAHPDDAFHFECAIAGATLLYATGLQRLHGGAQGLEVQHSMERHKSLLMRTARALLRDVRPAH
jgi:AcrR family transcriptional regulator